MDSTIGPASGGTRRRIIGVVFVLLLSLLGAAPTSQPTQEQIQKWFNQLDDGDSDVRLQAKQNLMGISVDDLAVLKKVVEASRPLRPSQTAVLHDIFIQVWIAGDHYEVNSNPLLGLSWPPDERDREPSDGVAVEIRVPGFSAYRMLQDGDRIVGVKGSKIQFQSVQQLIEVVSNLKVGDTMWLRVMRDSKEIIVPLKLHAMPAGAEMDGGMENFINQESAKAEEQWKQMFLPLLSGDVT